jgi:hypothetical protein
MLNTVNLQKVNISIYQFLSEESASSSCLLLDLYNKSSGHYRKITWGALLLYTILENVCNDDPAPSSYIIQTRNISDFWIRYTTCLGNKLRVLLAAGGKNKISGGILTVMAQEEKAGPQVKKK